MSLSASIALIAGLLYLAAGALLARAFYLNQRSLRRLGIGLAALAVVAHAGFAWLQTSTDLGLNVNFINILSVAALMVALVLLLTGVGARSLEAGVLVFPGAAFCVWLQWLSNPTAMYLGHMPAMLQFHILSALLAFSLLTIAALNAILLSIQTYLLRHPRPIRQLELLPPLIVLEELMFRLILAGWLLLTLALGAGLSFVDDLMAQHLVHKTPLSFVSWILFGLLLAARWWLGWRGRRAINWTLVAMFMLILAYFGSKFVLELMLDRTWSRPGMMLAGLA